MEEAIASIPALAGVKRALPVQLRNGKTVGIEVECRGCKERHRIYTDPEYRAARGIRGSWEWNGSLVAPTLVPSVRLRCKAQDGTLDQCHFFVEKGAIRWLSDSTHQMAGQEEVLPEPENLTIFAPEIEMAF